MSDDDTNTTSDPATPDPHTGQPTHPDQADLSAADAEATEETSDDPALTGEIDGD